MSYTSGETSKMLAIPGSTLRRYVKTFGTFLSPDAQRKRGRRFTDTDLAILSRIRDLASAGVKLDDIPGQLTDVLDQLPDQDTNALALPGLIAQFEEYRSNLDYLSSEFDQEKQRRRQWDEYHRQLAAWESLPFWKKRRQDRPQPPEF